jgi:SNF2 family DNA or RNA helicase
MGAEKTLVVAPKTVCVEWTVEAKKKDGLFAGSAPFYSVNYAEGPIAWRGEELVKWFSHHEPVVAAVNYEALPELWPYVKKALRADAIDSLVIDESHWVKSPKAIVSKTVLEISKNVSRCFCGSGTPIGNEIGDLHCQVDAVSPGLLASNYHEFMGRYAVMSQREIYVRGNARKVPVVVGARDLHDLMVRMDPIWFRASKAAVLDLPPKSSKTVLLPLPREVRALYEKVKEEGDAVFDELSLSGALVRDLRLSQICAGFCPKISRNWDDPPETGGTMVDLASPKIDWLKAFSRDKLAGDPSHRVVIWCRFTHSILRVQKELEKAFGRPGRVAYVIGGSPWTEDAISSLNSKDPRGVQIIVAQPKAIGTGKQLQGCDTMIFFDNDYSHIQRTQAEARMERLGRTGGMEVIDLVALGTIDEDVKKALDRKEDFAALTSPDTTFR